MTTTREWIRLRPALRIYKAARRRAIGMAYLWRRAPKKDVLDNVQQAVAGRPVILTVAYQSAWALEWQFKFAQQNLLDDAIRLIADNSPDDQSAAQIETLCKTYGATYIRLPFNRFSIGRPKDASLSHAAALNWTWRKIIKPARPPWCAIIDHDMIPLDKIRLENRLGDQPFFGFPISGTKGGWQIWPGYFVLSGKIIQSNRIDFWTAAKFGLDTGGSNYERIFRRYDRAALRLVNFGPVPVGQFDGWWHCGNASGYNPHVPGWRKAIEAELYELANS